MEQMLKRMNGSEAFRVASKRPLDGLRNLVDVGLRPQVIMTLMRKNMSQMEKLVLLVEEMGVGSVKFNLVQPRSRGEVMHLAGETLTIQEMISIGEWVEKELSKSASIEIYYDHPPAFRPLSKMFGENGTGCSRCGIQGILGLCRANPCLFKGGIQPVPIDTFIYI